MTDAELLDKLDSMDRRSACAQWLIQRQRDAGDVPAAVMRVVYTLLEDNYEDAQEIALDYCAHGT